MRTRTRSDWRTLLCQTHEAPRDHCRGAASRANQRWHGPERSLALVHRAELAVEPLDLGRVKGVLLEMRDVLYDGTLWWRWLAGLLARLRSADDPQLCKRRWQREFLVEIYAGRREFGEAFESFLRAIGLARGEIDEVLAAGLARRRDLEFDVRPFPGVRGVCQRLKSAGRQLAILSNSSCTGEELQDRLGRLGLRRCFDLVLSSVELDCVKPDPLAYRTAVGRMRLTADEVLYVAHEADDLAGSAAAGLTTVALRAPAGFPADLRIERIEELQPLCQPLIAIAAA